MNAIVRAAAAFVVACMPFGALAGSDAKLIPMTGAEVE